MNLIQLLKGLLVEGMPMEDLKDILTGSSDRAHIVSGVNGILILSNKKVVRCVNKYYAKPGKEPIKKFKSKTNQCHEVHQKLGVTAAALDCRTCHLRCIRKVEDSDLCIFTKRK